MDYRIGDEDIAGESIGAEEIAAAVSKVLRARAGMTRARPTGVMTPYGQQVMAREQEVRADLYQAFGLGSVATAVGAAQLSQNFLERFKPGRLILVDSTVGNSLINSIFIGTRPQSANVAQMPAAAFGPGAFETRVAFDTGEIGQPFIVNITSLAAGGATFSGMAFGSTIKHV